MCPTFATVAMTVFAAVLMTDTLFAPELGTYALVPSGLIAIPNGPSPTLIVLATVFVDVSITDTLSAS